MKNKSMIQKRLPLFLVFFVCIGCDRDNNVLETFKTETTLAIQREVTINHQLNPKQIYLMNDVIVLQNDDTDEFRFSIIDTVNFELMARFGRQGSGPDEIGAVCGINKINGDTIIVSDVDMEYYLFSIKKVLSGKSNPIKTFSPFNENGKVICGGVTIVGQFGFIVSTGMFAKGRYGVLDTIGRIFGYYVDYPDLGNIDNTNNDSLLQAIAFPSVLCNRNKNNMFASMSDGIIDVAECNPSGEIVLNNRIMFYDTEKKHTRNVNIDGVSIPVVSTYAKAMVGFDGWHFQGTPNSIYCLFSPRAFEEFFGHGTRIVYSDLLSFDWNGRQQIHYSIGRDVVGCAVSDNDSVVYFLAFNENEEPVILKSCLK